MTFAETVAAGFFGALLAFVSAWAVQSRVAKLARSRDADSLLREKGEALVMALLDHQEWVHKHSEANAWSSFLSDYASHYRAQMLQRLYFPELQSEMLAIDHNIDEVQFWLLDKEAGSQEKEHEIARTLRDHTIVVAKCIRAVVPLVQERIGKDD